MVDARNATFVVVEKETAASSPEERQMSVLLTSASSAARDVNRYHMTMIRARTEPSYVLARENFIEALERLVNLMGLADRQMSERMRPAFRSETTKRLYALRQETFDICLAFMIERIRRIKQRALTVLKRGYHPIGFAGCLQQGLETVVSSLRFMGRLDNLPPLQQQLIEETRDTVVKLSAIEGKLDLWKKIIGIKK